MVVAVLYQHRAAVERVRRKRRRVRAAEVARHDQPPRSAGGTFKRALVRDDLVGRRVQEAHVAHLDNRTLLPQRDDSPVEAPHGVRVCHLVRRVHVRVVRGDAYPRRAAGEARVRAAVPLHGRARVVARALAHDVERLLGRGALVLQDLVVVERLHVAVLVDAREVGVRHPQLLALVHVRRAAQQVGAHGQKLAGAPPQLARGAVAKARVRARLVVVRPKQRVPAAAGRHLLLPVAQQPPQSGDVRLRERPLVAAGVVHLQVVERKRLRQLVVARRGVADAVLDRGGAHLAHGHHVLDPALAHQLLQVLVHVRPIGIEATAVALEVVLQALRLRDQVHHVEAKAAHALCLPEPHHVGKLGAHLGVVPVQVRLAHVKQVQVPLVERGHVLPRAPAKLRNPVRGRFAGLGGRRVGRRIHKLVVRQVLGVAGQRSPEPLVARGRVVEHHVEHETDPARLRLARKLVKVRHRAEHGLHGAVVRHVVPVVVLRGREERGDPEVVDSQLLEVVQSLRYAPEVADAVPVGVVEAADVDLVDDLVPKLRCAVLHVGISLSIRGGAGVTLGPSCVFACARLPSYGSGRRARLASARVAGAFGRRPGAAAASSG